TGRSDPSHVLLAIGLPEERCRASLRLTVGWANTAEQIDEAVETLAGVVAHIRQLAGVA
ncbi:MAG: cysteine desulfurase NifS, partial [Chloroflexota bacterium]